jgi:putative addiction module antidote
MRRACQMAMIAGRADSRYNAGMNSPARFTKSAKLVAIGNSTGIVLPKELLDRLRLSQGDRLTITETPDGLALRSFDPEFERQMEAAEAIMREDRDILRELAK